MALNTAANLATIGSFAVDVFSLGFLTINRHKNICDPLAEADAFLDGAMDNISCYSVFLNDQEFETSMEECEKARTLVVKAYQDRSSYEDFIVRAKRFNKSKNQAFTAKLKCQEVANWVKKTSMRAKRRVDIDQQIIDKHMMEERLRRLTTAGFKLPESGGNSTVTKNSGNSAPDFAPTPSQASDELDNPFRDPYAKGNPWKTETIGSTSH